MSEVLRDGSLTPKGKKTHAQQNVGTLFIDNVSEYVKIYNQVSPGVSDTVRSK